MTTVHPIASIRSYHAHIYFDGAGQRAVAETLRDEIAARFSVRLGRWHDRLVGPHTRPMYQVAFLPDVFALLVPWLMVNQRGLAVLIHPNTGRPKADHLEHALWLGEVLAINAAPLPEVETGDDPLETDANTDPVLKP